MPAWATSNRKNEDDVNVPLLVGICGGLIGVLVLFFVAVAIVRVVSQPSVSGDSGPQSEDPVATATSPTQTAVAAGDTSVQNSNSTDHGWQNYTSVRGRFVVEVPGPVTTAETASSSGRTVVNASCELSDGSVFTVSFTQLPKRLEPSEADEILDSVAKAMAGQSNGTIRSEIQIQISSHPGREIVIDGQEPDQSVAIHARLYLIQSRVYQVIWAQLSGIAPNSNSDRFLRSFDLTQ